MHQNRFWQGLHDPPDPSGELTTLRQTHSWLGRGTPLPIPGALRLAPSPNLKQ